MTPDIATLDNDSGSQIPEKGQRVRPGHCRDVAWMLPLWQAMMAEHEAFDVAFTMAEDASQVWQHGIWDLMARQDGFVFVVPNMGFCCGWIARHPAIYASLQVGLLSEICVANKQRKKGVGRALMLSAQKWFQARDVGEFQLATAIYNIRAQQFFKQFGGKPILLRFHFDIGKHKRPSLKT